MSYTSGIAPRRVLEAAVWFSITFITGGLVIADGAIPSAFTTAFFVPIIVIAYRYPLPVSVVAAFIASVFSSPAMELAGVEMDGFMLPLLWLGWPAIYLFLAVSLNQWASLQEQRNRLEDQERNLHELGDRNVRKERELETLSAIHLAIMSGGDEPQVVEEITQRVAKACAAHVCTITLPSGNQTLRPFLPVGFSDEVFRKFFPDGAPYGEGVDGWAILHKRIAWTKNLHEDPRYERTRQFAAVAGFVSAAAAPFEIDTDIYGALMVAYPEEREFGDEELTRLERLARQTEIAIRSVRQRETLSRFAFETALALTEAIESRDPYTGGHCRRLAEYAGMTAQRLALPSQEIEVVRLGAALHDMGKIVVPDSILKKPDKLTPEEYAIVKQHCYSGGQICKRVGFLMNAYPIVYHHHERWDGKGYPDGIKGERIPLGARIVSVVDAYDAMTTDRPYRPALTFDEALDILREGAGRQWDPNVISVFVETLRMHPEAQHEHYRETDGIVLPEHVTQVSPEEALRDGVPDSPGTHASSKSFN